MTTITIEENEIISQTKFKNMLELYHFMIDNQLITEIWTVDKNDLDDSTLQEINEARKLSKDYFVNLK
jgi:hypothetical protein